MQDFRDRVALVTGSTSGIGESVARRLAALGARVVINSVSSVAAGEALADELGDRAVYVQGDISVADDCTRLLDATIEQFGTIDCLVNNAGWTAVVPHGDLDGLTDEIFRKTFDVNVFGTWNLTKAAIPLLRDSDDPNIVTITSIAGVRPVGSSMAYAMTKAALNHMTVLLAKSYGPIRVNAVAPGLVATPWTSTWGTQHAFVAGAAPLHRSATPDDCSEAVLAVLRNTYMTGQVIVVDGGFTQVI